MIRGIIFDCFGVLYGGSLDTLVAMTPPERLSELRDLNKQADYGYITGDAYARGLSVVIGVDIAKIVEIISQKRVRNQDLIDYAESLRPEYKVGLLSNVSSGVMDVLFTPPEREKLFDAVVLSYEEGMTKPNPTIFELMANRLGLPAGECVMIDDLMPNCEGAEVAGMKSILHTSNARTIELIAQFTKK